VGAPKARRCLAVWRKGGGSSPSGAYGTIRELTGTPPRLWRFALCLAGDARTTTSAAVLHVDAEPVTFACVIGLADEKRSSAAGIPLLVASARILRAIARE